MIKYKHFDLKFNADNLRFLIRDVVINKHLLFKKVFYKM